jgi:septal ring factor EnvC (AmiA/AmiB activator)
VNSAFVPEEIRDMLDELRRGVEKDQRIIADLKYRKAELERRLLEAQREGQGLRAKLVDEYGDHNEDVIALDCELDRQRENVKRLELAAETAPKADRERCIAALKRAASENKGATSSRGEDDWDRGYDVGFEAAIDALKALE